MATEEPPFDLILQEGAFEIRDYKARVVAEVTVPGDQKTAATAGFKILAGYIFGANTGQQGIAMTAPVAQTKSQKIAMTAPVSQTRDDAEWVVRFTMPAGYTMETLPTPNDARIRLHPVPPARMAVVRFSGWAVEQDLADKTAELDGFITVQRLRAIGPPALAQYNPPWTLWFMRRNEVMRAVEAE